MTERQRVISKLKFIADRSVLMAQEWKDVMYQAIEMLEQDEEKDNEKDNEKGQP